jgi:hypothetical protein
VLQRQLDGEPTWFMRAIPKHRAQHAGRCWQFLVLQAVNARRVADGNTLELASMSGGEVVEESAAPTVGKR